MTWILNVLYLLTIIIASPFLYIHYRKRGKSFKLLLQRFCGVGPLNFELNHQAKTVWLHGVSVGEIHLLRQVVSALKSKFPTAQVVVSASTEGGLAEANKAFPELNVIPFPLDFSWAVKRSLAAIKPDLMVLAESELWPNFLTITQNVRVPVIIVNARMSPKTQARYKRFSLLARWLFGKISAFGVQSPSMGAFLEKIGIQQDRVFVTGSVKFDGVCNSKVDSKVQAFGKLFGLKENDLVWVAGSTQAPEESYLLQSFQEVKQNHKNLKLLLAPRQPSLFDAAAGLLEQSGLSFVRRTQIKDSLDLCPDVILLDSLGELRHVWGLADFGFVGGSLDGQRGGQNMIEPSAYGAPVFFGPHIWNFKDIARQLVEAGGAVMISSPQEITPLVAKFASDISLRNRMGESAKAYVESQQGATSKTLDILALFLNDQFGSKAA
ncbi:MAG: 3-deoxy-D-manno-octulosonic acid transferase [Planctomycetia bacterium]